jgi:hypothetical protein
MFEDILVNNKPKSELKAGLEKNGEMLKDAILDLSKYEDTYEGFITCPGMTVTDDDCFFLYLVVSKDNRYHILSEREYRRAVRILVEKEVDGKFRFTIAI